MTGQQKSLRGRQAGRWLAKQAGDDGRAQRETRSLLPLGGRRGRRIGCLSCCLDDRKDVEGEGEELGQRTVRALWTSLLWVLDHVVELPEMVARAGRRRRKPH
uniref:Uncharacterized protein n=1 Tax=Oryza barthii TaxID=65489 RepID=A0A0D3ENI5_9ORYZ